MTRLERIARRFDQAAPTYDETAQVQRRIALALAEAIAAEPLPKGARVLELGCGTGHLTRVLIGRLEPSQWIAGDIAPAMLAALGQGLKHPALSLRRLDAADPDVAPGFDLVCSSLTLQWLSDPPAAIGRWRGLIRPGGLLAFSTLLAGSFGEWREALIAAGAPEPSPALPTLAELQTWVGPSARVRCLDLSEPHPDGLSFLRAARRAGVDAALDRTLSAGTLRRALKAFEAGGARVSYHAVLVVLRV
jgi:malonyl-CoA O-methyltransferase